MYVWSNYKQKPLLDDQGDESSALCDWSTIDHWSMCYICWWAIDLIRGSVPLRWSRYFTRVLLGRLIVMVMRQETRMISNQSFPITIGAIDIGFESGVDQSSDCVGVVRFPNPLAPGSPDTCQLGNPTRPSLRTLLVSDFTYLISSICEFFLGGTESKQPRCCCPILRLLEVGQLFKKPQFVHKSWFPNQLENGAYSWVCFLSW